MKNDPVVKNNGSWLLTLHALLRQRSDVSLGEFFPPTHEAVQLRGTHTLATNQGWQLQDEAGKTVLVNPHFSLAGPVGALPLVFTEQLGKQRSQRPTAMQDFFDIFNHRAQSLLYRALCKSRATLNHGHIAGAHGSHTVLLTALCGIAPASGDWQKTSRPLTAFAAHAGLFARRVRSTAALTQLLRSYFLLDIHVHEFTGRPQDVPPSLHTQLGLRQGRNNTLGSNALLGTRTLIADARITVIVQIHTQDDFERVQNDDVLAQLPPVVHAFAGYAIDVDVEIHTPTRFLPPARLNAEPRHSSAMGCGFGVMGKAPTHSNTCLRLCS